MCDVGYKIYCHADAGEEKKCVEKIVLEQETEWTQEVECHHRFVGLYCSDTNDKAGLSGTVNTAIIPT